MPRSGTGGDVIDALIKKAQLDDEATAGPIRLYEAHNNRIHKELTREYSIVNMTDYVQLVAERPSKEDVDADASEFIYAFHFHNEPGKTHGSPFRFRLIEVSTIPPACLWPSSPF